MATPDIEQVRQRLSEVSSMIDAVRQPDQGVEIVAVTKTFPPEIVQVALAAGLRSLGENYAQELLPKAEIGKATPSQVPPTWHFVGGLQRNKIRPLAAVVDVWQTIDRDVLVDELAKRAPEARMMVQVNTTGEGQKSGCEPDDAKRLVHRARERGLQVEGLMTVGPTQGEPGPAFERLRWLADDCGVAGCSMGMSGDFQQAVEAGATVIRLGTALFGRRETAR